MTSDFACLMDLFAYGARGTKAQTADESTPWEDVLRLAKEQSVYYIVLYAIKRMTCISLDQMRQTVLFSELQNAALCEFSKRLRILKLLEEFEASGIRVILLKGYNVASLYDSPATRLSADTDIFVEKKDESRAITVLRQRGFDVLPREKRSHHAVCCHPELGDIELHTSLYDEIVEEVWFQHIGEKKYIEEAYRKIDTIDGSYYSLGDTDNLIYLALHMMKHFIISGMSLRLIMDFALFFLDHEKTLNLSRFWHMMDQLEYSYFIKIVLCISAEYFHLPLPTSLNHINVKQADVLVVLDDLEMGGWLGCKNKELRDVGWYEYNRIKLMKDRGKRGYRIYMSIWKMKGFVNALFPSRNMLSFRFPYLQRSILLVPVAWTHRIFKRGLPYILKHKKKSYIIRNENQMNDVAKKRVALFKQTKIL